MPRRRFLIAFAATAFALVSPTPAFAGYTFATLDDPNALPGQTFAYGINDAGQVTGWFNDAARQVDFRRVTVGRNSSRCVRRYSST